MSARSLLVALLPVTLLSGALGWWASRPGESTRELTVTPTKLRCTQPPNFAVAAEQPQGSVVPQGNGFKFWGTAWLAADVCEPGTLQISAEGESLQGGEALLGVALGTQTLLVRTVGPQENISVRLDRPGRVFLGFLNDASQAENRVAFVENMAFAGVTCNTLNIKPSQKDRPFYRLGSHALSITSREVWTITPCAPGRFTFRVYGEPAGGDFPILRVEQGGRLLEQIATTSRRKLVGFNSSAEPVSVSVSNSYSKVLEDKNLIIRSLSFSSARQ